MATYRLEIHYRRTVTAFVEAADEADIDEFLSNHEDFDVLEDYPEIIEHDETYIDEDNEDGDYDLTQVDGITAGWVVTPNSITEKD